LYRTLDCLTEHGITHKISGDDRVFRYSQSAEHGAARDAATSTAISNAHAVRVFCLDDLCLQSNYRQLNATLQAILGTGFLS
jgi:Fur family ferric uptake transcriptional regulator